MIEKRGIRKSGGIKTLKRVGALVVALTVLLAMTGCKKKKARGGGAKSAEELVTKVLEVINEDAKYSEIEDWMDWYAWIAYDLMERTDKKCDLPTCKAVVEDLDEGAGYIKKHHKDFANAWEDATGEELTQKLLSEYADMKREIDMIVKEDPESLLEEFLCFAPYETEFDEERVFEREEYNIGYYRVPTGDEFYRYLKINYYIDDGNYVFCGMNWVA